MIDSVFNSFKLLDFKKTSWEIYLSPDSTFTAWLPGPFMQAANSTQDIAATTEREPVDAFLSHDIGTSVSYHVLREYFSAYYSNSDDSTFFKDQAKPFLNDGDSIVSFKILRIGTNKASDVVIENGEGTITKKFRFFLHGDTLYIAYTYFPRWLKDENIDKFFSQFSLSASAPATTLFMDKTSQLVLDLQSADSIIFDKASAYLYNADFSKRSLQQLHHLLLKPLKDFKDEAYFNSNHRLVNAVVKIADSSTVDFVLKNYNDLKGKAAELQYQLVRLLVEMEDPYAADAARKLLASSNPPAGDARMFSRSLSNNLPFAKFVFPQIISFTKDTTAALNYAHLINSLIDSNLITKDAVAGSLTNFIAAGALQKKQLANKRFNYDYGLLGILDLFAKIDNAESRAQLQLFSKVARMEIKNYATRLLLENNLPVAPETITTLAASDQFRSDIYEQLEKAKKTNLFPTNYLNQKMLASSYAFNYSSDDYTPTKVDFVAEKTVKFKGVSQKFYLFKVTFEPDDDQEPLLAIAGPFSLNTRKATSDNDATGVYWQESFSLKKVNEQFKAFLKQVEFGEEGDD